MKSAELFDGMKVATRTKKGEIFIGKYREELVEQHPDIEDGYIPVELLNSKEVTAFKLVKTIGVL